jgi:hypothetical protein
MMNLSLELRAIVRSRKSTSYDKNLAVTRLRQIAAGEPSVERDRAALAIFEIDHRVRITPELSQMIHDLLTETGVGLLSEVCQSELDRFIESRGLKSTTGDPKRLRKLWEATARK